VQDAFNNTVTSSTASITVAIGTNPGGGTLSGTTTVSATGGVASFPTLSINLVGVGYTLTASSAPLTGATSSAFNIGPAGAGRLGFITPPRTITAGACAGAASVITVQLQDSLGNPVSASAGGQAFTAASSSTGTVTWYTDASCTAVAGGGAFTIAAATNSVTSSTRTPRRVGRSSASPTPPV